MLVRELWLLVAVGAIVLVLMGCATTSETRDNHRAAIAPSEVELVCAHAYEVLIVQQDVGSPGVRREFMTRCMVSVQRKRDGIGEAAWARRRQCMLAGDTPAQLRDCAGRARPVPGLIDGVHTALAAEACEHMFAIMNREFGGGLVPPEDIPKLLHDCVQQLEVDCQADPVAFERKARCITSARNLDELARCEPP